MSRTGSTPVSAEAYGVLPDKRRRRIDVAASVDRDECEAMFGSDLDRCLDVTGHYQRRPVGTVEHESRLAIAHA